MVAFSRLNRGNRHALVMRIAGEQGLQGVQALLPPLAALRVVMHIAPEQGLQDKSESPVIMTSGQKGISSTDTLGVQQVRGLPMAIPFVCRRAKGVNTADTLKSHRCKEEQSDCYPSTGDILL